MKEILSFSAPEWNFLIRLVIAHLLSDFVFQTRRMVEDKKWNSFGLLAHIGVTMVTAMALTGNIEVVLIIGATHYFIDMTKTYLTAKYPEKTLPLFFTDQAAHLLMILFAWVWYLDKFTELLILIAEVMTDFKISLIVLAYIFCIWPSAFIVRFVIQKILPADEPVKNERIENGGRWIGQFERVIILTFVLLSEFAAIGFLITGKSIIRFADREHIKSEYVLAGTMLSYALAIVAGVLVNWLIT